MNKRKISIITRGKKYGMYIERALQKPITIPPVYSESEIVDKLKNKYSHGTVVEGPNKILKLAGLDPVMGRPTVGDVYLNKIMVTNELSEALETKAKIFGITVPKLRRKAYESIVKSKKLE